MASEISWHTYGNSHPGGGDVTVDKRGRGGTQCIARVGKPWEPGAAVGLQLQHQRERVRRRAIDQRQRRYSERGRVLVVVRVQHGRPKVRLEALREIQPGRRILKAVDSRLPAPVSSTSHKSAPVSTGNSRNHTVLAKV